ncbi:MAG: hypothetical protein ABFE07_01505 [Armatimonadia bacterium]
MISARGYAGATLVGVLLLAVVVPPASAVEIPAADVVLKCEIENFGTNAGLSAMVIPGASGDMAMALTSEAMAAAGIKLTQGKYTLLLRTFAPAGDQDGFFVEINGVRTRRVAPIGRWGVVAFPFSVKGTEPSTVSVIGQEAGMVVDQVVVVRGTYSDDEVDVVKLPMSSQGRQLALSEMPRFRMPARLHTLPQKPTTSGPDVLCRQSFDGAVAGVSGEHHQGEGKWRQAVYLDAPDGRLDLDTRDIKFGPTGTIEWWVKPRPAQRLWHDQGWHYFLYAAPAVAEGLQIDLSRHPSTNLRLSFTQAKSEESVELSTTSAGLDEWHHILVSWDLSGESQRVWLLFDGVGLCSQFPKTFSVPAFCTLQFCNTPAGWDVPLLPMDGGIDELVISRQSVSARLSK